MYKRKAYEKLLLWKKESCGSTAMLVEGARRVGKSTLVEEFAKREYASYALIDFSKVSKEFKQLFLDTRTDLDGFFLYLSALFSVNLVPRDTLVIFDEVQLFPPAREFIKHLVADGRYDYVETGSLISIKSNVKDILIPSEEESMKLHPMDFEEFLWAMGEDGLAQIIRASFNERRPLPDDLHRKAMRFWNEYMLVGGMPQAVAVYADKRNMDAADRAKRLVLKLYREDIDKYGESGVGRLKAIFDAIPGQLSKHEKRLVFSQVEEGGRARDYASAFAWFDEAATVNLCHACTDPSVALALSKSESAIKCYMGDVGLLATMAFSSTGDSMPEVYRHVLLGDADVNEGMLAENAVAQQFVASGHDLYFYSKWAPTAEDRMEVDFLLIKPYPDAAMKPRVSPVEVKSGKRYTTKSLDKFKLKFGKRVGERYILHTRQLAVDGDIVKLPLYMAGLL